MRRELKKKQAKILKLWGLALAHDAIDPKAKFVVFSESNPYVAEYNSVCLDYMETLRSLAYRMRSVAV